ncbi:thioredoxin family protein [Collimonas arenae]|uniref:Thioredoxin family protein n=2 Tax=Collimonas arenae TaxID=279058 RepID=A0A127PLT4_9BURK|nr:thioredoxin family protein [Collimonas arenae]AMP08271.1 thioredoxin family protein [Collimonas arenae]
MYKMKIQSVTAAIIATLICAAGPALALPTTGQKPAAATPAAVDGINWYDGDVDAAFAFAKAHNKPLFLYWGATWCPPCNQVKATIFNRQAFIERSRFFVPVHIDGDSPGAQKLGERFKVRGYPTMILFKPDGSEITRLPGEVDAERYLQTLTLGISANRPVKQTLQAALSGGKLTADEWRLLGYYSWDTDEQQLVASKDLFPTLKRLAAACPPGETANRLALSALVAAATATPGNIPEIDKAAAVVLLTKAASDTRIARENMDLLTNYPTDLVGLATAPQSPARAKLIGVWTTALQRLALDTSLSKTDRLSALAAQVSLARLDSPEAKLMPALLKEVRQRVAQADAATTDAYERQSVINTAAHALGDAGLLDESDTLLKAELKRSHAPYYFMLSLASNAKKRGDKTAAINWYEQAYQAAQGPATRLQWGAAYLSGVLELAPQDEARIEKVAHGLFQELAGTQNAFYERNRSVLERLGHKLVDWNAGGKHQAVVQRLRTQLDGVCAKLPDADAQRATCQGLLSPTRA